MPNSNASHGQMRAQSIQLSSKVKVADPSKPMSVEGRYVEDEEEAELWEGTLGAMGKV